MMNRSGWQYQALRGAMVWLTALTLALVGLAQTARAQETTLHTFNSDTDGINSYGGVIQGSDGNFYGTTNKGGTNNAGTVFRLTPTGTLTTLHSFTVFDGANPHAGLIQGRDGRLYGTTQYNGASGGGTVFVLNTDGSGFDTLYSFTGGSDGAYPVASLIQGRDGRLYGTAEYGGVGGDGTVFALKTNGSGFTVLYGFTEINGAYPYAGVIQGKDSRLYGTTSLGGANNSGVIFAISTKGAGFQTLYSFTGSTDGSTPYAGVIQGRDGKLYGTTYSGGSANDGTVFSVTTDGKTFTTLHGFIGSDGYYPYSSLIQGKNGKLYGTTTNGGANSDGSIFALKIDGTDFTTLHSFDVSDGANPYASLMWGSNGQLYGATTAGGLGNAGTIFALSLDGKTSRALYEFASGFFDGQYPGYGSLTLGSDGALYGTTQYGGFYNQGALYKLDPASGDVTILHSFDPATDGYDPYTGVTFASNGRLYGTTRKGGASGDGTIYALDPDGTNFTVVHSFSGIDGANPVAGVFQGKDSRLYGTTSSGIGRTVYGSIFVVGLDGGNFTTLHYFNHTSKNVTPNGGLIQGKDSRLYGTAEDSSHSNGSVFAVNIDGSDFTTLHSFITSDGISPYTGVIQGRDGRLYGTTFQAGISGVGTIFALKTDGTGFTTLHTFSGADGASPSGTLMQGLNGTLYGTTYAGGATGAGTVFALKPDGSDFTTFYSFTNGVDGGLPYAGVIFGTDGNLYGTTSQGGMGPSPYTMVAGTLFRVQPQALNQLPQIISFTPSEANIGATVTISGSNLSSATVTINGVPQTVTYDAVSQIKFKVAKGTTTGPITVTNTNGTATSATRLVIIP